MTTKGTHPCDAASTIEDVRDAHLKMSWANSAKLRRQSGHQFDPELVAALIAVLPSAGTTIEVPQLDVQPARRTTVGRRQSDVAIAAWLQGDAATVRRPARTVRRPTRPGW